jgi:phosphoserine phosphatase RsbU/P
MERPIAYCADLLRATRSMPAFGRPVGKANLHRIVNWFSRRISGFVFDVHRHLSTGRGYLREAWFRLTSGMEMEELWTQFKLETRESSRLYTQEVVQHAAWGDRSWKRPFRVFGRLSWNILKKLSPARRLFLLSNIILATLALAGFHFLILSSTLEFALAFSGILILLVLVLGDHISMKRDIEIAHEIQRWLLPRRPPDVPGIDIAFTTRPAKTIGGDYYDAFQRSGGGPLLIAVADVAGKSVPAAMLMATFQASLRALATSRHSLAELVSGLNRQMCSNCSTGRFTTAFIAEFDPKDGVLRYLCAGHNPPILRHANGSIERLRSDNIPLGIEAGEVYQVVVSKFSPDDLLLVYTDGVTEARNGKQQQFGEERLVAILAACGDQRSALTLTEVLRGLAEFVGNAPQHDDITCLVLRRA